MAVYGIGLVIKLIEYISGLEAELEQNGSSSSFRPRTNPDPTIQRFLESRNLDRASPDFTMDELRGMPTPKKKKRRASAYNKRYSKCFKKLQSKYKKKNGEWKKDGFSRCAKAARKCAKK